jgi:uncharacterized protein YndB with AHSA1/START domain
MTELQIDAPEGVPQVTMTRAFEAPRELVFRAFTDPELLVQWLGPRRLTMEVDRYEVRDGGRWRYVHRDEDGTEYGFHGVFHGDPTPDQMVQTFEFEGAPGHVQLDTARLEERDGRTIIHMNSVFQSVEARDAMVGSGMADGVREGFAQLDELLERVAKDAE